MTRLWGDNHARFRFYGSVRDEILFINKKDETYNAIEQVTWRSKEATQSAMGFLAKLGKIGLDLNN
jgi:hypothetical protein